MKRKFVVLLTISALTGAFISKPALAQGGIPSVSIRHISTAYANQGICSLRFGLGSSMGEGDAGEVTVKLRFVDPKGHEIFQGEISTSLDDSEAGRYQEVFLEDQNACLDSSTKIQVLRARAKIGKKTFDLLKLRKLALDDFKPMAIIIPK